MRHLVLSDFFIAKMNVSNNTKNIILILAGSWIIAALAQVSFYLPFTPIPITGQTLGVLLISVSLGAQKGFLSIGAYIVQGMLGLAFFAGGSSGPAVLMGPTAGYLLGFLLSSYVVGYFAEKGRDRTFMTALPSFLIGSVIIFSCGIFWLSAFIGFKNALTQGLLPFLPGELIKLFILSTVLPCTWKKLK